MDLEYFSLYFPDQSSFSKGKIKLLYEGFVKYFTNHKDEYTENWQISRVIEISLKNISRGIDRQIIDKSILKDPKSVISALSMAAHFTFHNQMLPFGTLYHVCINDWKSPIKHICELTSEFVGSFIRTRGIIQSSTLIAPKLIECRTKCTKCGKKFFISQSKKACPNCKNKNISLIVDDNPVIQYQQRFEVKDIIHICNSNCTITGHTFTLKCDIKGEMVNSIRLGEIVDVTGILKFDDKKTKTKQDERNFTLILDVNYVNKLQYTKGGYAGSYVKVNDGEMIQSLGNIKEIFPILINSFGFKKDSNSNPSICIHPMIKAAMLISMFSTPNDPIHILLSRYFDDLFNLIYPIIPHGVVFNEASVNKLTSSINKMSSSTSSPSKTWYVGGSFVQANQGLLMINDVDRFKAAQDTFLEITELGWERVDSLHKIRTIFSSIIVFDPKKLNNTVLNNAFTMIFDLDDELTNSLTSYITTPHSSASLSQKNLPKFHQDDNNFYYQREIYEQWNNKHLTFAERLLAVATTFQAQSSSLGIVEPLTFLKYVTYARQFVTPKWSQEAVEKLKDVASNTMKDMLAVRNMAQCRARMELRAKVEASDVVDCAEILEWSRNPPRDRAKQQMVKNSHCRGNSKQKMIVDFMTEFKKFASYKENGIVDEKEMKEIADMLNITAKFYSFEHFLDTLTINNLVLLSGPKKYRIGSTL